MADAQPPVGIIAGAGEMPARLADHLASSGRSYLIAALEGFCAPATVQDHPHFWVRLGAVGAILARLQADGIRDLCLIGGVSRPSFTSLMPDAKGAALIARLGPAMFGGDDALLQGVRRLLESEGFRIHGVSDLMAPSTIPSGCFSKARPNLRNCADIERGWRVVAALGDVDVGQAAVVQQGLVIAVEAIEGTDRMLARVGDLLRDGDPGVLVKRAKPDQDRRLDLPTIGPKTVESAVVAGLAGIAVQANATVIVDPTATVAAADAAGIFLLSVGDPTELKGWAQDA